MAENGSSGKLKFGIVILPEYRWAEAKHIWRRAEAYGFDHAWTYDHLGWRDLVDGPWFDAVPTLTAAATVTSTIRLGTHVASANFRHPAAFAREVTALDDISNGRLLLGVGAGGQGFDATVLGQQLLTDRQRLDRYVEFASMLDAILNNRSTTSHGEYFSAVDARSTPGSLQKPRIPLIVAGNFPRSIAFAARLGDGWITTGAQVDDLESWWIAVARNCTMLAERLELGGRATTSIDRYLSLDAAPTYSLSSVDAFTDFVGRATDLGFNNVVSHWPRRSGWYAGEEAVLDEIANIFLRSTVV
jgi:alkanesulfonate monooxygenase SsuD/methylene tetrahydromethanopterin reductase-like flavin-dependent oxidoreductase (luciferase family)